MCLEILDKLPNKCANFSLLEFPVSKAVEIARIVYTIAFLLSNSSEYHIHENSRELIDYVINGFLSRR